jgi:dehydrogenase/reductase SDR family member 7B
LNYFEDKIIWITGASSGIGEQLSYELSKVGASLIISSRNLDKLNSVRKKCYDPSKVIIVPFDISVTDSMESLVNEVINEVGKVDILINNAGISQRSLAENTSLSVNRKIMEINYFGTICLSNNILSHFLERKAGKFVIISSVTGKVGFPMRSSYCASKHALEGYFESLRTESWNKGISILIVNPAAVKTRISLNALKGNGERFNLLDYSTENGYSVEKCAIDILNAIRKNKKSISVGKIKDKLLFFCYRFLPGKGFHYRKFSE